MKKSPVPCYVAGIGCRKGTPADELVSLILSTLREGGIELRDLGHIATLDRKASEPGLIEAARTLGLSIEALDRAALEGILPPSPGPVADHTGLPGVAEAIALRVGAIAVPKRKSANATCAIGLQSSSAAMASSTLATSFAGP